MRETLTEIARDPSITARSKLLSSLSDMIFDQRRPTVEEVASLCAVATPLLSVADDASRCHFAGTIAPSKHVPREMVFHLLQDSAAVAGPLLLQSPVLSEDDLIAFATTATDELLNLIAQRDEISAPVVEILVDRGSATVQLSVAENSGAVLSAKSLQILIRNANSSEPLCRSLVRRQEVSKTDAEQLVQLITKMLKARMRAPTIPDQVAAAPVLASKKPEARLEIGEILASVKARRMSADQAVTRLADEDRFNDLTALISSLASIDDVSIMRLLVRADVNGIGMIMRALDISDASFGSIIALRKRRLKSSEAQIRFERDDYAKLSVAESKATLAQLNGSRGRK